ncbi:BTB/POZ domain-containing protein [Acorus calamus]|uniref:BTB/POZ domain-containing protein n=1 Tax=Acorus calamus TaxID=4465 RepID=A0AAV9FG19_ACOCL|nr:BTB/POZ domain-containing protein [Acorus calamus]
MGGKKQKKFLTVAPFECAWREELKFREAGRGCVAFEAFALNDVTIIFREQVGSQYYHYKIDNNPNYTIILGSNRNRRLKIEVDGKTVVDVAGVGLCSSSAFQSYWISIYDGLISIGEGRHPFQNLIFQWLDSNPNRSVQYVGLSSWDRHVGYRNVNVLPLDRPNCVRNLVGYDESEVGDEDDDEGDVDGLIDGYEEWGLANFLESGDLSDIIFVVGIEEKAVPAHKLILEASCSFSFSSDENVIRLPSVTHSVLHAVLQYIYTGRTQIVESQLIHVRNLSLKFQIPSLVKQSEEAIERFKMNKKLFDSGKNVELQHFGSHAFRCNIFPCELPIDVMKLKSFLSTGKHSDVGIYVDGHGLVAQSHKLILSLWSSPFAKMFTNGMIESCSSDVCLGDVSSEALSSMLQFMYSGKLEMKHEIEMDSLLVQLLLLADQFGVASLHRECCKAILECMSEDSVCAILQVISSIPSCKMLEDTCERIFSMHFDYCTTASTDFVSLDEATFKKVLEHPHLTVTSEERILDAILVWCMQANELCGWEYVDELLKSSTSQLLFRERLSSINVLLPLVRFPLMPSTLLEKLEKSVISDRIPVLEQLVMEAVQHSKPGFRRLENDDNVRLQHRRSSFKELQYICDGDNNGVIYFSGTSYGVHQWMNPVVSKKITVTASSPISRYTDPKALVSRTYQATSFAGPKIEDGHYRAWWMVDIGQDHQLMCNYYTLRHDGSSAYQRAWSLQGSLDGETWANLRVHENDRTICKPGQFASWPVNGPMALRPFRFFRVLLTGPTTCDSNPWNFCICFLELYGFFH